LLAIIEGVADGVCEFEEIGGGVTEGVAEILLSNEEVLLMMGVKEVRHRAMIKRRKSICRLSLLRFTNKRTGKTATYELKNSHLSICPIAKG
jgi:hypothetical protein